MLKIETWASPIHAETPMLLNVLGKVNSAIAAVIAALLGAVFLFALRQTRPERRDIVPLTLVATGAIVGFPLLTALALQHITAAHSIVFIGLLPLTTALFGALRGGERPKPAFWLFSVAGFALYGSNSGTLTGDLMMIAAILVCGLGCAEGATLSRRLGGWQVISWALLLSLPIAGRCQEHRRKVRNRDARSRQRPAEYDDA